MCKRLCLLMFMIGVIWNFNGGIILWNIDYFLDLIVDEKVSICIFEKKKRKKKIVEFYKIIYLL